MVNEVKRGIIEPVLGELVLLSAVIIDMLLIETIVKVIW